MQVKHRMLPSSTKASKRNRSKLNLKKKETNFLHSANAHRNLKQIEAIPANRVRL
jgi:hypothetical protein